MSVIIVAKNTDGEMSGNLIAQKVCHAFAPSSCDASIWFSGTASSAAEKISML